MAARICIQGYPGSFHQVAAQAYYGKQVSIVPCHTFKDLVIMACNMKQSDGGLMAIENSIAGSILPNYNLLQESDLVVTGEIYLRIRQHLLVNPGVTTADIREVHSHTMALQQCHGYLDKHNWKLVETEDTAFSAKKLRQHRSRHIAGIGSRLAASLYELDILANNIQTLRNNYTRFLALQPARSAETHPYPDKASVNFHTDHSRGSLAKVLTKIAEGGINLSKLQSMPIPGSEFRYSFHADMEFDSREAFDEVVNTIRPLTDSLKIYGIYKKGIWK